MIDIVVTIIIFIIIFKVLIFLISQIFYYGIFFVASIIFFPFIFLYRLSQPIFETLSNKIKYNGISLLKGDIGEIDNKVKMSFDEQIEEGAYTMNDFYDNDILDK